MGQERGWLYPAAIMTLIMGAIATIGDGSPLPLLAIFPLWLLIGLLSFGGMIFVFTLLLMFRREVRPTHILFSRLKLSFWPLLGFCLAGINMCSFMRIKPLLNHFVPFTADPVLAAIDRVIFLGNDGAKILAFLSTDGLSIFYSRGWFAFLVIALILTLFRTPSSEKNRLLVVYFALWTFIGPIVHSLAPAAGPVFYKSVGFGSHFDYISLTPKLLELRNYLWHSYVTGAAGPGAGISAMPSLHVATTAWAAMALRQVWPAGTILFVTFTAIIIVLSVALGWHYLIDGIVGVICAIGVYKLQPYIFSSWQQSCAGAGDANVRTTSSSI